MKHRFNFNEQHLPQSYRFQFIKSNDDECEFRASLKDRVDIRNFVIEFGNSTNSQWNVRRRREGPTKLTVEYVCHHSSFMKVAADENGCNKRGISKNASCPARIRISINISGSKRCSDSFAKIGLWARIRVSLLHTHTLNTAKTLRFLQDKDGSLRETFFEYFSDNMISSEAKRFHEHKLSLRDATEAEFANGSINPTDSTIEYWFSQWRLLNLGPRSGAALISKLEEKKCLYAEKGTIIEFTENPLCVMVSTPLMQRAHALPSSKELAFIDSTSACDAGQHSVTFILTTCAAGAVPLAVILTSGQSTEAYAQGFKLTKKIPGCFGKKGFPKTILTDNSAAEIAACKQIWPNATNLLCTFHVLQAVWRWLWDAANGIQADHRVLLMNTFKAILRSNDLIEMESAYSICVQTAINLSYQKWLKYMEDYYKFKERWVLAYRDESLRGHHTNNYSEASIRIFKDIVLSRVKAYNVVALVDFCATSLEDYYVGKLRNFSLFRKRESFCFFVKSLKKVSYLTEEDIIRISESQPLFLVPSEKDRSVIYTVDCDVGRCTCNDGKYGKFCKHQCAVYQFFKINLSNFPPISATDRYLIAKVALGKAAEKASFYDDFITESNEIPPETPPKTSETPEISEIPDVSKLLSPDLAVVLSPSLEPSHSSTCSLPVPVLPSFSSHTARTPLRDITNNSIPPRASDEMKKQLLEHIFLKFEDKVNAFPTSNDLIAALEKYSKHMDNISSEGLLLKFLNASPRLLCRVKSNSKIKVQSTSISRRKAGVTRGCKKIAAGRVAKSENTPVGRKDRAHCISRKIIQNLRT